jgi:hypothetical protein
VGQDGFPAAANPAYDLDEAILEGGAKLRLKKALDAALLQDGGNVARLVQQDFSDSLLVYHNDLSIYFNAVYCNKIKARTALVGGQDRT